ncbi:MAG: uroporphyrinogen decarboxylase [Thermaurantiacus sp.]
MASLHPEIRPSASTDRPRFLRVLAGEALDVPPVWLMRQAGRYLAEYRALRAEKGGFLDLVTDPEAATEVTLQPIRRFGFDAAILFSDILIVPWAMGQGLAFLAGEGPQLSPRLADAPLETLVPRPERAAPVFQTVARVRAALDPSRALIGFAGSPWTVATYAVAGEGSRDQEAARLMAWADEGRFARLIDRITEATATYLLAQAEAGADALMLFDSWSGSLAPGQFERWVIAPTARLVEALRASHPDLPIIGFPRGAGTRIPAYARETGVNAVGLDETVDPAWADAALPPGLPVQGNLDPHVLIAGGPALDSEVRRIVHAFRGRPHIFNLGHGIRQETPVAHVEALLATLRAS